ICVVPHLRFAQAAKSVGCRKPTEFIQNPSQRKIAEGLLPESRASAPGCPLRSGDSKRAEFSVELMVSNVQPTVQKLSGQYRHLSRGSVFALKGRILNSNNYIYDSPKIFYARSRPTAVASPPPRCPLRVRLPIAARSRGNRLCLHNMVEMTQQCAGRKRRHGKFARPDAGVVGTTNQQFRAIVFVCVCPRRFFAQQSIGQDI